MPGIADIASVADFAASGGTLAAGLSPDMSMPGMSSCEGEDDGVACFDALCAAAAPAPAVAPPPHAARIASAPKASFMRFVRCGMVRVLLLVQRTRERKGSVGK